MAQVALDTKQQKLVKGAAEVARYNVTKYIRNQRETSFKQHSV